MGTIILIGTICVIVALGVLGAWTIARRMRAKREIFIKYETMAGPCRIFTIEHKDGLVRVMNVAGTMQSATYLDDDAYCDLPYSYTRDYNNMFSADIPIKDVLVMGGGGYSYPKHLIAYYPDVHVTCVEIDPTITALARRYFFLDRLYEEFDLDETGRLELVEGDARAFLEKADDERFDVIVNDCFCGMQTAQSLATQEAVKLYHEHLRPGGLYMANVIGAVEGPRSKMMRRILRTLASEFAHVYILPGQPDMLSNCDNNVVIATDGDHRFTGAIELEAWELSNYEILRDDNASEENWTVPQG